MPYQQLPQIDDRKSEKLAVFLTVENMLGLAAIGGPVYLLSSGWPLLIRAAALLLAAVVGVALTVPVAGMPLYMHAYWLLRGLIWRQFVGDDLTPDQLAGAVPTQRRSVALPVGGVARTITPSMPQPLRVPMQPSHAPAPAEGTSDADRAA